MRKQPLGLALLIACIFGSLVGSLVGSMVGVAVSQESRALEAPAEPISKSELSSALSSPLAGARIRAVGRLAAQAAIADELWPIISIALEDDEAQVRQRALQLYAAHPARAKQAVDKLVQRMGDESKVGNDPIWAAAADALVAVGPTVIPLLIDRLEPEKNVAEYQSACAALSQFGPRAEPALGKLIKIVAHEEGVIGPALFVIQNIGPKAAPAVPVLIARLEDENFHHQYWACRSLGAIGRASEPSVPKLIDLLKNGVTSVRRNAAMALGEIGVATDPVLDDLTKALTDPISPVRQEAILALGKFGPKSERSLDQLTEIALNENGSCQSEAAWAWWQIDDQSVAAVEVLFKQLKGRNAPWDASRLLADVADRAQVIERIAEMLDEPNAETRMYVVQTLEQIGPPAKFTKARLKSLLEDSEVEVREAAARAIEAVETPPAADLPK